MRVAAFALLVLVTPAVAASAPHGPGCALSARECAVVVREMAADDVEAMDDERAFGYPTDLRMKHVLNERRFARLRVRVSHLPPLIGQELARLRDCQAGDRLALLQGTTNDDPKCR